MDIKEILGITEMYELNKKLEQILPDKQAREVYFNSITQSGVDLSRAGVSYKGANGICGRATGNRL